MNIELTKRHSQLTRICYTVYRCNLRCNERISSETAYADEIIKHFKNLPNSVEVAKETFQRAEVAEAKFQQLFPEDCGAGGVNFTHPERVDFVAKACADGGWPEEWSKAFIELEKCLNGKIYFFPSMTALYVLEGILDAHAFDTINPALNRMQGETEVHYAIRFAYMTMCHERRHTGQNFWDNAKELAAANINSVASEGYATLPHEVDANNFAIYNCTNPLGMYTYAC